MTSSLSPQSLRSGVKRAFFRTRALTRACWLVLLALALQNPCYADPADAARLFDEAQRAFRSGDSAGAVALYRQADAAGFADPVLFFNLGVANYRLGHYRAARDAFLTASATPSMAPLSFYNLGLVARKRGEDRDAAAWFDRTLHQPRASAKLRALAFKARASLADTAAPERPSTLADSEEPTLLEHLRLSLNSGLASDSNIYRSPSKSYVDLSDPAAPTVVPVVQSGMYLPLELGAEFRWGTHEDSHFAMRYDLNGRRYYDAQFANANEVEQAISFENAVDRKTKHGRAQWRGQIVVSSSNAQAYDRDDGQEELVGGENVSDRFSYTQIGPRVFYHRDIGALGFGFRMDAFIKRYAQTLDFLDLTHGEYLAGAHLSLRPLRDTLVKLSGDYSERLYTDRTAKDINGLRLTTNDKLDYRYQNLGLTVRQRLWRTLVIGLGYSYTRRGDVFQNYDEYARRSGRAYVQFRKRRFSGRASFTRRIYDFPNAFAFDNLTAARRTLDTSYGQLEAEYRASRHLVVRAQGILNIVQSSDPRLAYDRNQLVLGVTWRM